MTSDNYTIVPKIPDEHMECTGENSSSIDLLAGDAKRVYIGMTLAAPKDHNLTLIDRDELEALRRDADRYKKLKSLALTAQTSKTFAISKYEGTFWSAYELSPTDLDEELDAAIRPIPTSQQRREIVSDDLSSCPLHNGDVCFHKDDEGDDRCYGWYRNQKMHHKMLKG